MTAEPDPAGTRPGADGPEGMVLRGHIDLQRNVLIAEGDPRPLHRELEFHLLSIGVKHDPLTTQLLSDGLGAMALYMLARPRFATFGWTVSLREPPLALFFTGSLTERRVIARAFLENVTATPRNLFYAQTSRPFSPLQCSTVEVDGIDIFAMVEKYSRQSDQQPARYFHEDDGRAAILLELPDADRTWFADVEGPELFALADSRSLKRIAETEILLRCGCDTAKIARVIADANGGQLDALFENDEALEVECPRCGTQHQIRREHFRPPEAS